VLGFAPYHKAVAFGEMRTDVAFVFFESLLRELLLGLWLKHAELLLRLAKLAGLTLWSSFMKIGALSFFEIVTLVSELARFLCEWF
jgi:hypothetical protein